MAGLGLTSGVQGFVAAQMAKRDRRQQDIINKLNEEAARLSLEQKKQDAARFDEYMTMLEREATPTYPTSPGAPQVARQFQFSAPEAAKLKGLKGVYGYQEPKAPSYQQYGTDTEYGAFNPQTGEYIKRGAKQEKPGRGASVSFKTPEGLTISGAYDQVKPYMDQFGVKKPKEGAEGDPRWEQAVDNAYRELSGGEGNIQLEALSFMKSNPGISYLDAINQVIASKNINFDQLMQLASRYYNAAQNPGQYIQPSTPEQNQPTQAVDVVDLEALRKKYRAMGFKDEDINTEFKKRGLLNAIP